MDQVGGQRRLSVDVKIKLRSERRGRTTHVKSWGEVFQTDGTANTKACGGKELDASYQF